MRHIYNKSRTREVNYLKENSPTQFFWGIDWEKEDSNLQDKRLLYKDIKMYSIIFVYLSIKYFRKTTKETDKYGCFYGGKLDDLGQKWEESILYS
jgi:hypothetical protein